MKSYCIKYKHARNQVSTDTDFVVGVLVSCGGFFQFLQFAVDSHFLQLQLLSRLLLLFEPARQHHNRCTARLHHIPRDSITTSETSTGIWMQNVWNTADMKTNIVAFLWWQKWMSQNFRGNGKSCTGFLYEWSCTWLLWCTCSSNKWINVFQKQNFRHMLKLTQHCKRTH